MENKIDLNRWLIAHYDHNTRIDKLDTYSHEQLNDILRIGIGDLKYLCDNINKKISIKFFIEKTKDINILHHGDFCYFIDALSLFQRLGYIKFYNGDILISNEQAMTEPCFNAGYNVVIVSLYIKEVNIDSIGHIINHNFDKLRDFLLVIKVLCDGIGKDYNNDKDSASKSTSINFGTTYNDAKYLAVCNDAMKESEKSDFATKTLDCYLFSEKEWFLEQCDHILHIANIMDGIDENDLLSDNWTIDVNKCNKIIGSLKYRANPFNKNLYISEHYPLSCISETDIQHEQLEHKNYLIYLYRQYNTFLYSCTPLKKFNKSVNTVYNEYTPYSIYHLSKEQANCLSNLYNIEQKNILLDSPYDFIQTNEEI
jgi:hypothetical protein